MKRGFKILFIVLLAFLSIINLTAEEKIDYDIFKAEGILRETYGPLHSLVMELELSQDKELLLLPAHIKEKEDLYALFKGRMEDYNIEDFFEDFIIEKEDQIFLNPKYYIPSIYSGGGEVRSSYLSRIESFTSKYLGKKEKVREVLIIEEMWKNGSRRKNSYTIDENGNQILSSFTGSIASGFEGIEENPWKKYWKHNK